MEQMKVGIIGAGRIAANMAKTLDGMDDAAEHRRGIARTGADLQDPIRTRQLQSLGHVGHDIGLGDGLTKTDRQRHILPSLMGKSLVDKGFPGNIRHSSQHPLITDALIQ